MIRNKIYRISQIVLMACLVMTMVSCRETIENIFGGDDIAEGEEVMFTTSLPSVVATRATAYTKLAEPYEFTIGMYTSDDTSPKATGTYTADTNDEIGTLKPNTPLYWPDTKIAYGFKAIAGKDTLEADQSTKANWLAQDRLSTDDQNIKYHTAKEWKAQNENAGLVSDDKDYKKIPLNMYHQRSLISIILKAGEGVSREALNFDVAKQDLRATIYSYGNSTTVEINPLACEATIDYETDKNGAAEPNVGTTRYDAIVEPYDYSGKPSEDLIARINLSGQNFSFYTDNDKVSSRENYNLTAGKHLTITATLSRDSRKVMMSAYIEDWTEEVTNFICDDYGHAGEPIEIESLEQLKDFLGGANNKAGNVALVKSDIVLSTWSTDYSLNCTLNLGGHKLTTDNRFLKEIGSSASLQNGTIEVTANVDAAIAETNEGTIEDVKLTAGDDICASTAGAVIANAGTISKCHSALKVSGGSAGYVGGIAATSISPENKTAIIDGCTVTNRVEGGTTGGGIVGLSKGNVTNNTFEYGITLSQVKDTHKNIVGEIVSGSYTGNAWPTVDENLGVTNAGTNLYTGIIDCEADFGKTSVGDNSYRLAKNIEVSETVGDVAYELDGNGKKITTSKMIFKNITGKVHDLTVVVSADMIATPDNDKDYMAPLANAVSGSTAEIRNVKVLAEGKTIQAANPAGLVVWANNGATISNCEVTANIKAKVINTSGTERNYAGGIVSTASVATISQCVFHSKGDLSAATSGAEVIYYGGIVGGVNISGKEKPKLTITDCTNFCNSYISDPEDAYHGGILGYAKATDSNDTTIDCQGNWWPDNKEGKVSKGVAVCEDNKSVEATIGKRNAVKPTEK